MELRDETQARNTREKLRILEDRFEAVRQDPAGNAHVQELTLRSLKRIINQLKEELARFQAHAQERATK